MNFTLYSSWSLEFCTPSNIEFSVLSQIFYVELSKDVRSFWPKHQAVRHCHGKMYKQKPCNWVYIMNELFSLLSWRHFKKSQKHHQINKIWLSVIELTDIGCRYVAAMHWVL
jgi:hypothetical protein